MNWHDLEIALCLVLVVEGIIPFLSPTKWRSTVQSMLNLSDSTIRRIGLGSMIAGTLLLYLIN
ncbi:MAG: DUF2065 domain-containing protein [Pseudomonadales bacterium]|nr:DUF2065 domain-containing protein [Pseudomonadales bacterium]